MEIEDIIFLGAGASASEGAPLQSDLFKEFFSYHQTQSNQKLERMVRRLADFFKTFFGIDITDGTQNIVSFPTFEEVLGILELALNREESFKGYSLTLCNLQKQQNNTHVPLQQIREDLIFLIAIVLKKKLHKKVVYHKKLVERLKNEKKLNKTVFISLNYDIIIDNSLMDLYPDYHLDYGIDFTNFEKDNDWKRPESEKAVRLYKLHGSLNWLYCQTCISIRLTPKEKKAATLVIKPQKCDVCKGNMIPIIIPPTFFKIMSNFYLQLIWRKTETVLQQAKRIIFCGYSFPDADIHIKYLLKRAEINKGFTPEIIIINNHKDKSDFERVSEKERYMRFFKDKEKVRYTNLSFEKFCERCINQSINNE